MSTRNERRRILRTRYLSGLAVAGVALLVAASGASAASSGAVAAKASGDVDVLSAGSLDTLMTKSVGPAFHKATGYTLVDTSGGSSTLAADIKNKVYADDIFVSASPTVTQSLEGSKNGSWVSWYADFADSPEVLGYDPKSKFAADLRTKPWYDVVTMPGFLLGRTNPTQDPGGVLAAKALTETATAEHIPALKTLATETSDEYPEDTEEAGIQNGQLDAAFMYAADAISQGSPYVKLVGPKSLSTLAGEYTISILKGSRHTAAAAAVIKLMLGSTGKAEMKNDKFGIVSPAKVSGKGVPSSLVSFLKSH
jgi:molybdate/tungstate transport system substrate-binding protein